VARHPCSAGGEKAAEGPLETDLLVVGGGFTGLWTALRAVERDPGRSVILIEAARIADHATGRNGGFCEASLTHGERNGRTRWPAEYGDLHELGMANLDGIEEAVARYGIECGFVRGGTLAVATRPHEVAGLRPDEDGFLDATAVRAVVDSPTYLAGRLEPDGCALVDPARLAWGLAETAERLGVRVFEGTRLDALRRRGGGLEATAGTATIQAKRVVVATNVFNDQFRRARWSVVPVYDYVLATEPLTDAQLDSLRWDPAVGISDAGNQFHYYRVTPDQRICGAGTTRSTTTVAQSRTSTRIVQRRSRPWPGTSRTPSPSCTGSASPIGGLGSSTPPPVSAPSSGRRTADALPTPRGSPAWVSGRPGSLPTSCSTSSGASTPDAPGWRWCAGNRSPSRPSPSPGSASRSPAGRWLVRTRQGGATGGFAPWTGSGSGSIRDPCRVIFHE
jgi:glycine/D-amino acid oxidase-like deaminating enzyme